MAVYIMRLMNRCMRTITAAWRRRTCAAVGAAIVVGGLLGRSVAAQEPHTHVPLEVDATLDWPTLIAATLAVHPRSVELVARADEAAAWNARGRNWLAAAPALYFSYLSDRPIDNYGQREYEAGVELPLWRAGQRSAVQAEAIAATSSSAAAADALRLEVAGLLRGVLWDIEAAAHDLAAVRDTVAAAEELARVVERRNARGDLSRADVLLARAALLEKQQVVVAAEAALLDAERAYRSLTGLERRPAGFAEPRAVHDEITPSHPLLALADAEVERARSHADLVDREQRGNLTVAVGPRRQFDPFGILPTDSMVVAVRVPVGGKAHGVAQHALALRLVAATEAERGQLFRRLDLDLHEAEHALLVLEESAALAAERLALAEQQAGMAQSAFAQGEIELRELLRIEESRQAARRDVQRLAIEQQRTIAALNQALGEMP
jgi:cobalt-zinc-cadmium efflux system outer membrane protein